MKKSRLEIKKIPLKDFIETLVDILNNDVEYINLIVEKGNHQDNIWIVGDSESQENTVINKEETNFEDLV